MSQNVVVGFLMLNESDVFLIIVNNVGGLDCVVIVQEDNSLCFSYFNDNNYVFFKLIVFIYDIVSVMC